MQSFAAVQDPREYLPFLRALRALPPSLQRHQIDDHLGRHASALRNLAQAGDEHFDDAVRYAAKHSLWEVAHEVYEGEPSKYEVRRRQGSRSAFSLVAAKRMLTCAALPALTDYPVRARRGPVRQVQLPRGRSPCVLFSHTAWLLSRSAH